MNINIREEIKGFISCEEKNGALLLTGKWGCGKTYLVRQIRDELNKEAQYAIIMLSLFGVNSIEELNRKVKENIFKSMMGSEDQNEGKLWRKKVKTVLSSLTAVLGEFSNVAKGVNTALTINPYDLITVSNQISCRQNGTIVKKELVLVFDDFERSRIDKVELLGAINDYSENNGIKTILIADEDHIDGDEYKDFKEKLVSRTVKIEADYAGAIWTIVRDYKESTSGFHSFLEENIGTIALLFMESKTENIRSFKAFLMDFERVYSVWKKSNVPESHMPDVLYAFGAVLFEYKSNNYVKDEKYGYLLADGEIKKKYSECKGEYILNSLTKWIVDGDWNEKAFLNEISQRFSAAEKTPDQLFLYHDFWDLTQEIVFAGLTIALQKAYAGELGGDALMRLLQRAYLLKAYAITTPTEIDYGKVSRGLDLREEMMKRGEITEDSCHTFIQNEVLGKMDTEARALYRRLERLEERCEAWNNRRSFITFIENKGNIKRHELKHHYLISFDDELLTIFFEAYKSQGNGHKRELIFAIKDFIYNERSVTSDEDFQVTIDNINKLGSMIRDLLDSEQDAIARVSISESIKALDEFLEELKDSK